MPKIKLKLQDNYDFEYKRIIHVKDINYGGHLSNDALVTILHEARIDLLFKLSFNELDIGDNKTGIIMTDLAVNFIKEGFMLDEISIYSHIGEISTVSFRIFHKILKNDQLLAIAETGIYTFDYNAKSVTEIPEIFKTKLSEYSKSVS